MPDAGTDTGRRADNPPDAPPKAIPTARRSRLIIAVVAVAIVLAIVLVVGTLARIAAGRHLRQTAHDDAIPTVSVVHPDRLGDSTLVLPARLQAWEQAPIYARIDGYLKHWYYDIGAKVPQGAVLADIEAPEVDQQLTAARAGLQTADAQRSLAATTSRRFTALAAQNAASQQDADTRQGDLAASRSQRDQAAADVGRLQALLAFKRLVAPFDGTVTARNTDTGNLIAAGQGGAQPLFIVADLTRLRLYVSVPQIDIGSIRPGLHARFTVPDHPGHDFDATVASTADAVDPQSGAMLVQLAYDNADGTLKPGEYAEITFRLPPADGPSTQLRIPASSLLFRAGGTSVAVAQPDGTVRLHKIAIITDFGTELQVDGDLKPDDWIIDSPPDALGNGDKVHAKPAKPNRHA